MSADIAHKKHEVLGYILDDVESEYLDLDLINSAADEIDFSNASSFIKLSWALLVGRLPVVQEDE